MFSLLCPSYFLKSRPPELGSGTGLHKQEDLS